MKRIPAYFRDRPFKPSKLEKFEKHIKYSIAAFIPLLYLQGNAYHQGKLTGYGISPGFYPIGFEQALSEAFYFYIEILKFLSIFGAFLLAIAVISTLFKKNIENTRRLKRITSINNFIDKFINFVVCNKSNFILPGLLLFTAYALLVFGLAVATPYLWGKHNTSSKLETFKKNSSYPSQLITIKNTKNENIISAFIIRASDKYISVYDGNNVFTFPASEIKSVKNIINKSVQQKAPDKPMSDGK